jgi:serine O-acetyltransferase
MRFREFIGLVESDLYRHTGNVSIPLVLRNIMFTPGFKYSFWMRLCTYLSQQTFSKYSIYWVSAIMLAHYRDKYGIDIPFTTQIGRGLYIGHSGGIVVGAESIGNNFSISQGVTIGQTNRGEKKGRPTIGNNVYVGPGAIVIGNIKIGDNVAIGANSVVTKDIPDNAVVVGVPGRVISYRGAEGYLLNPT